MAAQATQNWTEEKVRLAQGEVRLMKGGSGDPLVVLSRDNGFPGWQAFHESLAAKFTVHVPTHPGFGRFNDEEWTWMGTVRDLAIAHGHLLDSLGLSSVTVVGLGFGGWLAAELATMRPQSFERMVLVSPMGIQPQDDYIYDQFLVNPETYARQGFHNIAKFEEAYGTEPEFERLESWETMREMISRIGWKPYMYNRGLPHLLESVETPTLVVWGRQDRVVPLECGQRYVDALPNARLEVIEDCGHVTDLDQPDALSALISDFVT